MSARSLRRYLDVLGRHAGQTRVPGLDVSSRPLPLADIFVQRDMVPALAPQPQRQENPPISAIEVLAKERALAVLGEPGQGKSTLLKSYASALCAEDDRRRLPLLVELAERREKVDKPQNFGWLWERLPIPVRTMLDEEDLRGLASALREGRAVVLLDGLDELSKAAQEEVRSLVGELVERGNQVVITSRPHVYWAAPIGGFAIRHLAELNPSQLKLLAGLVCQALAPEFGCRDADRAVEVVLRAARDEAAAVAKNPLFLSFMCLSAVRRVAEEREDELPNRPVALIGECLDVLVAWHKRPPRAWPEALSTERIVRILGPLALRSLESDGTIRPSDIEDLGGDDKAIFHDYLVPARLIEQHGGGFAFPTGMEAFREYFAARAVARDDDPYALLRSHLHDPSWRQVIAYAAGSLEKVEAWRIDLALPFATWLGVKSTNVVIALIPGLIKLLGKPYEPVAEGAKEIAKEVGPKLQTPLEKKLKDSRRSVEYLVTRIVRHGSPYEEILARDLRLAADCLANAVDCTDRLADRFLKSVVRILAETSPCWIEVLRGIRPQGALLGEAMQTPMDALAAHESQWVRELALHVSKGQVRLERMLRALRDTEYTVRSTAADALVEVPKDEGLKRRLLPLTELPDWFVQRGGMRALGAGSNEERERMLESLHQESSWAPREAAARALGGAHNDLEIRDRLLGMVDDPIHAVRREAALAVSIDDAVVRQRLLELTRDDPALRYDAVLFVWRAAAYPEVWERLLELTRDDDPSVRKVAVRDFNKALGEPKIRARLIEMLDDRNEAEDVRAQALETLAEDLANPEVRAAVLSRLHDEDGAVKASAIRAAAKLVGEASVLSAVLDVSRTSPASSVRSACVEALSAAAGDDRARERLLEMTWEENGWGLYGVVRALRSAVSMPPVKARLVALTADQDKSVRGAVVEMLKGIVFDPEVERRFRELLDGNDDDLYWLALESLLEGGALDTSEIVDRASERVTGWASSVGVFERLVLADELRKAGPRSRST